MDADKRIRQLATTIGNSYRNTIEQMKRTALREGIKAGTARSKAQQATLETSDPGRTILIFLRYCQGMDTCPNWKGTACEYQWRMAIIGIKGKGTFAPERSMVMALTMAFFGDSAMFGSYKEPTDLTGEKPKPGKTDYIGTRHVWDFVLLADDKGVPLQPGNPKLCKVCLLNPKIVTTKTVSLN